MRRYSFPMLGALGLLAAGLQPLSAQTNQAAPAPASPNGTVVGSPLLRDFDLGGERTTPPAPQQPAPAPDTSEAPAASNTPGPSPAARPQATAPARSGSAAPTLPRADGPPSAPAATAFPTAPGEPSIEIPSDIVPAAENLPQSLPQSAPALPEPQMPAEGVPILYWAAPAALLALLLGFFFFRRRRRDFAVVDAPAMRETLSEPMSPARSPAQPPVRTPAPAPAARPVPDGTLQIDLRPWLEIEFKPEKMVTTAEGAAVHFELTVKNVGRSPARNVRIQAQMFNPSAEQQQAIKAFFATPTAQGDAFNIAPQLVARFNTSVLMPRERLRSIEVQGRPLFIPSVAINILYEWGEGRSGQTSKSYVIGTEQQSAEKMGPFRLDLGPRIYRQVGGRPLDLARAV